MPHMMPMLWLSIFISSLIILFLLSILIYFFYIPTLPLKKKSLKYYKWNWTW